MRRWLFKHAYLVRVLMAVLGAVVVSVAVSEAILDRTDAIQQSRLAACRDQNKRHDNTIRQLDVELRIIERTRPRQAAQAKASRQFTVDLIDTLAPKHDCERLVGTS